MRPSQKLGIVWPATEMVVNSRSTMLKGRVAAMEILNNNYACANLIRTGKLEQLYSQLQIKTQDRPDEKMITMEKHLAMLVKQGSIDLLEARKWVNNVKVFVDAMKQD